MSDSIPSLVGCQPALVPVAPFPRVSLSSLGCPAGGQAALGHALELATSRDQASAGPPESEPIPDSNTGVIRG